MPDPLINDAFLISEMQKSVIQAAPSSKAPGFNETSVFMVGKVAVGIILPESVAGTENWTPDRIGLVVSKIMDGMQWWNEKGGAVANLSFVYDIRIGVDCVYEPITISSANHQIWVKDVFANMGYSTGNAIERCRQYLNDLRASNDADWAIAFIVADSYFDYDGRFPDSVFSFSYTGGPYAVMTYDNGNWGIEQMNKVAAHETGHMFYAADEYCGPYYTCNLGSQGYLYVENGNCECETPSSVPCIMRHDEDAVCEFTKGHLGWRDSDGDGIADQIDTVPEIGGASYTIEAGYIEYTGFARDVPYDSPNPAFNDVTINKITSVEYRINGGSWQNATASDGAFNSDSEDFVFRVPIPPNNPTVEIRAKNTVGNFSPIAILGPGDVTPPSTPIVNNAVFTTDTTTLSAQWSSIDPESGLAECEYAIGSSPGLTDIKNWTAADLSGSLEINGLTLQPGSIYFISVKTRNQAGLWSLPGTSDGVIVVNALGIDGAKNSPDGIWSGIENAIATSSSSDFGGFFYVQNPDRSSGIKIYPQGNDSIAEGQIITLYGITGTDDGERKLIGAIILP